MTFLDWFTSHSESQRQGYEAVELTEADVDALTSPYERKAVVARPYKSNDGIPAMEEVLESLHSVDGHSPRFSSETQNVSPAFAFEIRYGADTATGTDRTLTLQYLSTADETDGLLERQLQHRYHDSQIERRPGPLCHAEPGQYAAGATLGLRKYSLFPIENIQLDGWRSDPTGSILTEMARDSAAEAIDATVVTQLMFKPASRGWLHGVEDGHGVGTDLHNDRLVVDPPDAPGVRDLSKRLTDPVVKRNVIFPWHWVMPWEWEYYEDPPTRKDKAIATMLEELDGKAWQVTARIFALSDDPDVAVSRVSKTANMFRNYYEYRGEQEMLPQPLTGDGLRDELHAAADREWRDSGIVKPQVEVAGLVNIPEAQYVSTNKMEWSLSRPGEGVPVGTPRYDFDAADVSDAADEAKQVAMLTEPDAGRSDDAFWFGFGSRNGTEVGVYEEYLNAHAMVTGGTRRGKTTALTNLASQIYDRGYGALVIVNGKEKDEDRFIEEWPADRDREDFVFIDTGDPDYGTDKRVRFNLLELPTDAEPGTNTFESAVQTLTDDWSASFAEAGGGSDNYWGALMSRVTRTVINGLTKSGMTATPLDVAAAVSTADGLGQFRDLMNDERIDFVREAAERIAEKEDADLEPLAGRTDLLTQHAGLRNFLCARTPTASIQEFVREGKVCVLRVDPNLGETETKFMLTPLVRRFYTAKKTLPDAPRFYLIWDEFDKGVSPMTNIHEMLSIAGGHDFRMILACQAPSNQLYDRLKKAMQNQIDTAISFGTGEEDARYIASHHTVDAEDLAGIGRYKFWLRTYYQTQDDEDKTYSYKIDAFPPAREARAEVDGTSPVDPDELKRESAERYGDVPVSAEQLRAESAFYGDGDESATDAESGLSPAMQRALTIKAVFDESLVQERTQEGVPARDVVDRLDRYLPAEDTVDHNSELWSFVDAVPADELDRTETDDDVLLRATELGRTTIFETGKSAAAGTGKHRLLLRDAYPLLTRLGMEVSLAVQAGTRDVDGVGRLRESFDPERELGIDLDAVQPRTVQQLLDDFADEHPILDALMDGADITLEAETTTQTHPGLTIKNLAKAYENGQRCLFVTREDAASTVWELLTDPPLVKAGDPDGDHTLYNDTEPVRIDGEEMQRPGDAHATVWRYESATDEYVLADSDGTEHARFPSASAVFSDADRYPEVDGGRTIYAPVVPQRLFGSELPTTEEWDVLVVSREADDGVDPAEALRIVRDGETHPLSTLVGGGSGGDADVAETLERIKERRWGD